METTLIKGIEVRNDGLILKGNTNSPCLDFFSIVQSTEKAIKVLNQETQRTGWLPKSALKHLRTEHGFSEFSFEMWFRKADNGRAITKAFYLIHN